MSHQNGVHTASRAVRSALELHRMGFSVIPVRRQSKIPKDQGWPSLRLTENDIPKRFGTGENVGVLLGEPSNGLVDVDLDHPLAVKLAPNYLPPTGMSWGRVSKPRSHFIYRLTAPVKTRQFRSNAASGQSVMLLELRSTGAQTVAPGSTHESGEEIVWHEREVPASLEPQALTHALTELHSAIVSSLGESRPSCGPSETPEDPDVSGICGSSGVSDICGFSSCSGRSGVFGVFGVFGIFGIFGVSGVSGVSGASIHVASGSD